MTRLIDLCWRLAYRAAHRLLCCWWWLRRPAAEGAGVAVWCDGRLLVVKSSYRETLDLSGGGIETGETARSAAARELREEVGITAPLEELHEAGRLSFVQEHRRITDTVFEWRTARRDPPQIDGREIVWADWLTLAELRQAKLAQPLLAYVMRIGSTTR